MQFPHVTIIILTWNSAAFIKYCLESCVAQDYPKYDITVIDNGSQDDSVEIASHVLEESQVSSKIIKNSQNLGFAVGMNQGIKGSSGSWFLLLNSDCIIADGYLSRAVSIANDHVGLGGIGGTVFQLEGQRKTDKIDAAGYFLSRRFAVNRIDCLSKEQFVFGLSGACSFLNRKMLDEIRLSNEYFDESYFAYFEDLDLYFRANLLGWKFLYSPSLIAWHLRSGSQNGRKKFLQKSVFFQHHYLKNRYFTIIKNTPARILIEQFALFLILDVAMWLYIAMNLGLNRTARVLMDVVKSLFVFFPSLIQKRCRIQESRKVSIKQVRQFFRGVLGYSKS